MNDLTKENIKIALCNALADDKNLMQKDVAKNFGTDPVSISYVKNPKYWHSVQQTLWDDLNEWRMSGKKLKGYIPKDRREKEFREGIKELNKNIIIPLDIHKYSPEEPVISKKFGIEVEVRMRIKGGN